MTSHDVAELAGVSRSAVSRTFTDGASVSKKTREKVQKAADKLGYQPNVIARSLIMQESRLIGLVMVEWLNPFYTQILRSFTEKLQALNYQVILAAANDENDVDSAIRFLMRYQADGILVVSARPSESLAKECRKKQIPIVLINRQPDNIKVSSVTIDQKALGKTLANSLLDRGYKRFALVQGNPKLPAGIERTSAFKTALRNRRKGKVVSSVDGIFSHEDAKKSLPKIMKAKEKPDIILCSSDLSAMGIRDGLRIDYDIEVPKDMSIVGFGDTPAASWGVMPLTTVRLPIEDIIHASIECLLSQVKNFNQKPSSVVLEADIVWRDTT